MSTSKLKEVYFNTSLDDKIATLKKAANFIVLNHIYSQTVIPSTFNCINNVVKAKVYKSGFKIPIDDLENNYMSDIIDLYIIYIRDLGTKAAEFYNQLGEYMVSNPTITIVRNSDGTTIDLIMTIVQIIDNET